MKPNEHPSYDDSIRHAVERAMANKGDCFSVWWDGEAVYVRASEAAGPKNGTLLCIAQHWAGNEVQVRYPGGRSEWVH